MKYSCLFFAEGRTDNKFLTVLIDLPKFKYHLKNWNIIIDNGSGCSPEVILAQCEKACFNKDYDFIQCFIDLDVLKTSNPKDWENKKKSLEAKYSDFNIIWNKDSMEDEFRKVLGKQHRNKRKLNKLAKQQIIKFFKSEYWYRIVNPIKDKEKKLPLTK